MGALNSHMELFLASSPSSFWGAIRSPGSSPQAQAGPTSPLDASECWRRGVSTVGLGGGADFSRFLPRRVVTHFDVAPPFRAPRARRSGGTCSAPPRTRRYRAPPPTSRYMVPAPTSRYRAPAPTSRYRAPPPTSRYRAPPRTGRYGAPPRRELGAPQEAKSPAVGEQAVAWHRCHGLEPSGPVSYSGDNYRVIHDLKPPTGCNYWNF